MAGAVGQLSAEIRRLEDELTDRIDGAVRSVGGLAQRVALGLYPIVTLEKQLLNMIGNLA